MDDAADETIRARRRLLQQLAAGGATAGVSALLPERWVRPVVDAVVVPLHAQTSPALLNPLLLQGTWSGGWTDIEQGTSGTASMTVSVDTAGGTFTLILDLNGPVLASTDPGPQTITGTFSAAGGTIRSQVIPRFGVPDISISPTGAVNGSLAPLPEAGGLQVTGSLTASSLVINYTGNAVFPTPKTFAGTLTLNK